MFAFVRNGLSNITFLSLFPLLRGVGGRGGGQGNLSYSSPASVTSPLASRLPPSHYPRLPQPNPNLPSPQKYINSDWVRVCLASVTFKMASKVFIEETNKNFDFIPEILFRFLGLEIVRCLLSKKTRLKHFFGMKCPVV